MINIRSVAKEFPTVVLEVWYNGDTVEARNYETRELRNLTVRSSDPSDNMWFKGDRRELLRSEIETVRWGEEPQVDFSGTEYDDKLDLDDGTFYEDIIRTRISEDWDEWLHLLKNDPATRKACSLFGTGPNPPCTSRVQWMIRDGRLNCYSYNRSQDIMFAFPMDMGLFEAYQCKLAEQLGVPVGYHEHTMTSAHIYMDDEDEVEEVLDPEEIDFID